MDEYFHIKYDDYFEKENLVVKGDARAAIKGSTPNHYYYDCDGLQLDEGCAGEVVISECDFDIYNVDEDGNEFFLLSVKKVEDLPDWLYGEIEEYVRDQEW